jgi:double-stranded uracil-DNA glycosylase
LRSAPARLRRLRDCIRPGVRILLVGINPGIRSATIGHHFAGYSNRFWKLLYEAGVVPEAIGTEDDHRLPEWGFGVTNLVARATPGIDTLRPAEYLAGVRVLRRKVRRFKPELVAFVGVSLYRAIFAKKGPIALGLQNETFEGARVFVLPNPSGRNANYSYAEMLGAFRALATCRDAPKHGARRQMPRPGRHR